MGRTESVPAPVGCGQRSQALGATVAEGVTPVEQGGQQRAHGLVQVELRQPGQGERLTGRCLGTI